MSNYDKIAWLPLCGGLTGLGLVLSYLVMRRRGLGSGLRGAAFSLLPLAAYLTGAIKMLWKMGVAIGDFATGFVFSTRVWSGIAVTALAVVLFVVSGPLRRRSARQGSARQGSARQGSATEPVAQGRTPSAQLATRPAPGLSTQPSPAPVKARKGKAKDDDDDDLADVADILRRHGIT